MFYKHCVEFEHFLDNFQLIFSYFRRTKTTVSEKQDKHVRQFEKCQSLDISDS